jgi:hypothetical protein
MISAVTDAIDALRCSRRGVDRLMQQCPQDLDEDMHRAGDILERANRKVLLPVIHTGGLICCPWPTGNRRGGSSHQ